MDEPTAAYTPPPPPGPRFAAGQLLAGRFRVVAALGAGGMGEVVRADDLTLGQPVALKFLPADLAADPDRLDRLRKEVAVARQVAHPHVCRVYDIGEHAGQPFLAMEFVDGEDLASVLRRLGRVPEEKGVEIARQLCGALAAVHEQGLLHRDLKPANVMLDGRGRVRLTDFGLAAVAGRVADVGSGTPKYMAPEQLARQGVTARSDLFALGLVLYELFTGRHPFPGADREAPPSKPSSHVSTLSPAVERVILRCLEPDPAARPRSAREVLLGLPGGDPLAAALAAGETPSPKLVADAPVEGTLRPAVAGGLFAAVVVMLLVIAALNDRWKAYRHIPLPPPAVLEDKARERVRKLGYTDPPFDAAFGFGMPDEYQRLMARNRSQPAGPVAEMADGRPAVAVLWYRQSPTTLVPYKSPTSAYRDDRLSSDNPPVAVPGMVNVLIDTHGRLVELRAAPDPAAAAMTDGWAPLLSAAGLDGPGVLRPAAADGVTPPTFADRTAAWDGSYPERPDLRIRVEAASYRGRPVFFRITHPDWGLPPDRPTGGAGWVAAVMNGVWTVLAAVLVAFAVRNVRRGRADVRGAAAVGGTALGCQLLFWLLAGGHLSDPGVWFPLFQHEFTLTLFPVGLTAAGYLALEPVLRRTSPRRLTAWSRLTAGRWRDPLVGRHVLIGLCAGVASCLDYPDLPFLGSTRGPVAVHPHSFTHPLGLWVAQFGVTVGVTWIYLGVFAVARVLAGREWAAAAIVFALFAAMSFLVVGWPGVHALFQCARYATALVLFLRLGTLAALAGSLPMFVLNEVPLTLDRSAWYFTAGLLPMAVLVGLAGYGAVVSLGGRPVLGGEAGERADW